MQGSSFLRPDPTASSPTRMRLAPLQHSPSANAARVHVPTQSEVNARLGGSFSTRVSVREQEYLSTEH